jgi:steroid 5-alpha reductase family enzyme
MLTKLKDQNSDYKIPQGGLFQYVSCANYLGELIEWWGVALITRAYPQIAFAIFSSSFLVFKAWHTHKWLQNHFGSSYPISRKALVPFIF